MPRKPKPPFIVTPNFYDGLSRTDIRRMRKGEQRELMLEWFHDNYEDPANETPYESREGGYQYIWGGPYEAADVLGGKFGGLVSDSLIEEVAEEVQSDGLYDWAPNRSGWEWRDEDDDGEPALEVEAEFPDLDALPDQPGPAYGGSEDLKARGIAVASLDELRELLDTAKATPPGIGHNQPPEAIDQDVISTLPAVIDALLSDVVELKKELESASPRIPTVKKLTRSLLQVGKWIGRKLDLMADEAAKTAGKAIGAGIVAAAVLASGELRTVLWKAIDAVVSWLHVVTSLF